MVSYRKTKPMGLKRINILLRDTGYQVEKLDNGELVITGKAKKQVQPNLFAHLKKD